MELKPERCQRKLSCFLRKAEINTLAKCYYDLLSDNATMTQDEEIKAYKQQQFLIKKRQRKLQQQVLQI
jgi:hypothetical protein